MTYVQDLKDALNGDVGKVTGRLRLHISMTSGRQENVCALPNQEVKDFVRLWMDSLFSDSQGNIQVGYDSFNTITETICRCSCGTVLVSSRRILILESSKYPIDSIACCINAKSLERTECCS